MPRRFPLQTLLDFALNQTDEAARSLHALKAHWTEVADRLEQLRDYQKDYQQRLEEAISEGMRIATLRDYQAFLAKIEVAIKQQQEELERSKQRWESGRTAWHTQKRKLSAYDILSSRHHTNEMQRESRIEQRVQDELAMKSFQHKDEHE